MELGKVIRSSKNGGRLRSDSSVSNQHGASNTACPPLVGGGDSGHVVVVNQGEILAGSILTIMEK